jgi:Sec-independent protein translocase protein TatA
MEIAIVALLVRGPKRLPAAGQSIRAFEDGIGSRPARELEAAADGA